MAKEALSLKREFLVSESQQGLGNCFDGRIKISCDRKRAGDLTNAKAVAALSGITGILSPFIPIYGLAIGDGI